MSAPLSVPQPVAKPVAMEAAPAVDESYKAREVEGFLDIHFYRKIGFQLALFFAKLRMTPSQVTLCGAATGIAAGHLYYYPDLRVNLLGMVLHVFSNALDNADGQLARLTKKGSRTGRVFDGFADHLVFVSIYAHLCLRYTAGGGSHLVWLLALGAGVSHNLQSAAADYCRNAWLHFSRGKSLAGVDSAKGLEVEYERVSWRATPRRKFWLRLYLNYTRQQEWLLPRLSELEQVARDTPGVSFSQAYREAAEPSIGQLNFLATNPRMILLFALLLIGQPVWYFLVELTVFNLLLVLLLRREDGICRRVLGSRLGGWTDSFIRPAVD